MLAVHGWKPSSTLLASIRVVVCLGQFAYREAVSVFSARGHIAPRPRPRFGHGVEVPLDLGPLLLLSYHPSQQNTFTGKLTEVMFDAIFARAAEVIGKDS